MTKITIISCIIAAVCVFQTAEAGLFDRLSILDDVKNQVNNAKNQVTDTLGHPLGDALGNVKNQVDNAKNQVTDTLGHPLEDALGNVKNVGEGIQNGGKQLFDGIKNGVEAAQKALQTSTACTDAYNEGQKALTDLISIFKSCLSNATKSVSGDVQELPNDLIDLLNGYGKWALDGLNCYKEPLKVTECFSTISQDINDLGPKIQKIVDVRVKIFKVLPSLRVCYENAFRQSVGPNAAQLVNDGKQCISNILQPFKL